MLLAVRVMMEDQMDSDATISRCFLTPLIAVSDAPGVTEVNQLPVMLLFTKDYLL